MHLVRSGLESPKSQPKGPKRQPAQITALLKEKSDKGGGQVNSNNYQTIETTNIPNTVSQLCSKASSEKGKVTVKSKPRHSLQDTKRNEEAENFKKIYNKSNGVQESAVFSS